MRWRWLAGPSDVTEVIVIFGGWASGPAAMAHLLGPQDILFIEDWRELGGTLPALSRYMRRTLVAWSFGVAAYAHWQAARAPLFDRRIAICGSPVPVDRQLGIPPAIFRRTRDSLSAESLTVFLQRIGAPLVNDPDVNVLRDELDAVSQRGAAPALTWDRVIIGRDDPIFPVANLHRAFAGQPIEEGAFGHTPFSQWRCWSDLTG